MENNKKLNRVPELVFYLLLILAFFSFMFSLLIHQNDIKIPLFSGVNADIRMNIEADGFNNIKVFANDKELIPHSMRGKNTYINFALDDTPVYTLSLKLKDDKTIDDINNIVLFTADKMFYFNKNDIKKFDKKDGRYYFPKDDIKCLKTSKFITDRGNLTRFSTSFLSVFYNMNYYIFPVICFIFAVLIYLSNKDKIELGFGIFRNHAIWFILILGFLIRLYGNNNLLWLDELYVTTVAGNPNLPFSAVFSDPGNPPLFFIFARYWQMLFGANSSLLRLLPCIFSVLSIYVLYIFIKDNVSKNAAILTAFLYAISVYSIYSAHEYRSYSLCTLFCALSGYLTFKIIKSDTKKDINKYIILYTITAVLMANTHYFQTLILFSNFLYLSFQNVSRSVKIKFFIANIMAGISLLPYFIITSFNKAVMDETFNVIKKPDIPDIISIFIQNYTNSITVLTVLAVGSALIIPFLKKRFFIEDKSSKVFLYSLFVVLTVFVSAFLISQIRPVIRTYYFVNVLPFIIAAVGLISFIGFKNKTFKIVFLSLFFISYFMFGNEYERRDNAMYITAENTFKYAYLDSMKYKNSKIALFIYDYIEYSRFYKQYIKENETIIKYPFLYDTSQVSKLIDETDADIVYFRMELPTYAQGAQVFEKYKNAVFIRTSNDSLIARIVKNDI